MCNLLGWERRRAATGGVRWVYVQPTHFTWFERPAQRGDEMALDGSPVVRARTRRAAFRAGGTGIGLLLAACGGTT